MLGAMIGDICGSTYEFHNVRNKGINLFPVFSRFTDDTVMTIAVSKALSASYDDSDNIDHELFRENVIDMMRVYGNDYRHRGYGTQFKKWLKSNNPEPYMSCGNGSAMRVSSVGWASDDIKEVMELAKISAEVSHNHPEGIKGAQAVAMCIYVMRVVGNKGVLKEYVKQKFQYDLDRSVAELRATNKFYATCQKSVPEAIICFLEGEDFEDVIRNAISIGGDSDTIAAIAGSIAEATYPIPEKMVAKARKILGSEFTDKDLSFYNKVVRVKKNAIAEEKGFLKEENYFFSSLNKR